MVRTQRSVRDILDFLLVVVERAPFTLGLETAFVSTTPVCILVMWVRTRALATNGLSPLSWNKSGPLEPLESQKYLPIPTTRPGSSNQSLKLNGKKN